MQHIIANSGAMREGRTVWRSRQITHRSDNKYYKRRFTSERGAEDEQWGGSDKLYTETKPNIKNNVNSGTMRGG